MNSLPSRLTRLRYYAGNFFEHFDKALYSLMAPWIISCIHSDSSYCTLLFLMFLPYGAIFKPLGSYCLGLYADHHGPAKALTLSLAGLGLCSCMFYLLPSYFPIIVIIRGLMDFFTSIETSSASILLLRPLPEEKRSWTSYLFECSSMLGILTATLTVYLLVQFSSVTHYWKSVYLILGIILGIISLQQFGQLPTQHQTNTDKQRSSYKTMALITALYGISYANYHVGMTIPLLLFPNLFQFSKESILLFYCGLIILDLFALPLGPYLAKRHGTSYTIQLLVAWLIIGYLSLFMIQETTHWIYIYSFQGYCIFVGAAIASLLHSNSVTLLGDSKTHSELSLVKSIASQLLGVVPTLIATWFINDIRSISLIACYMGGLYGTYLTLSYVVNQAQREARVN